MMFKSINSPNMWKNKNNQKKSFDIKSILFILLYFSIKT